MSFLSENLTQFTVAQFAYPTLAAGYGHIGQMALVLNHLVDSLLEGVLGDEPMHQHVLMLADTVGAVVGRYAVLSSAVACRPFRRYRQFSMNCEASTDWATHLLTQFWAGSWIFMLTFA